MSEDTEFRDDLCRVRASLLHERRARANGGDGAGVAELQRQIDLVDEAIEDEGRIYNKEHRPFMAFI